MLRTVQLLPQEKGSRHWASTRTVSNPSRQSATGPPESYPDRTHTGKRRRARTKDHSFTRSPPVPLGARKIEARILSTGIDYFSKSHQSESLRFQGIPGCSAE